MNVMGYKKTKKTDGMHKETLPRWVRDINIKLGDATNRTGATPRDPHFCTLLKQAGCHSMEDCQGIKQLGHRLIHRMPQHVINVP